ncbi:MAG: exonuclease SbcCD subunit D [Candidatus Bathyarchaeia archaeon]|nr:exonuclease SbcCD subunit D [Candidatus Bathyarchaeota archaeon]
MRIIHTSDLHLGVATYGSEDPSSGVNRRILDFFQVFDQVIDYTLSNDADVLLMCGDTFKDVNPTSTILKMFAARLRRLTSGGVDVVILLGNHDTPKTVGRTAPPEIFDELKIEKVYVSARPDILNLKSKNGEKLRIFTLPYRHPIHVAAKIEKTQAAKIDFDREAIQAAYQTEIKRNIEIFTKSGRRDAEVTILAGHLYVEGARRGSEKIYIVGEEYAIPPSILQRETFDYIALGHVHTHQRLPGEPPAVYSGSLERIDFSEVDETKGFIDMKYKDGIISWSFIPVKTRPMLKLEIDCTKSKKPIETVKSEIGKFNIEDAIVKIILKIKNGAYIDLNQTQNTLSKTFWHQIVQERIFEEQPIHTPTLESLNPHETLSRYLKSLRLPEDEVELLRRLGDEIVEEIMVEAEKT